MEIIKNRNMEITIKLGVGNRKIYHNEILLYISEEANDFLSKYLSKKFGRDSFIFVGEEATIELPNGLKIDGNKIDVISNEQMLLNALTDARSVIQTAGLHIEILNQERKRYNDDYWESTLDIKKIMVDALKEYKDLIDKNLLKNP